MVCKCCFTLIPKWSKFLLLSSTFVYHEPNGNITIPPGWDVSPSQDTQHRVTSSIITPIGWDVSRTQDTRHKVTSSNNYSSSLDGMVVHCRIPSILSLHVVPICGEGKCGGRNFFCLRK